MNKLKHRALDPSHSSNKLFSNKTCSSVSPCVALIAPSEYVRTNFEFLTMSPYGPLSMAPHAELLSSFVKLHESTSTLT